MSPLRCEVWPDGESQCPNAATETLAMLHGNANTPVCESCKWLAPMNWPGSVSP